jgi:hypothetical protein
VAGSCKHGNESSGSIDCSVAEQLLASQEGPSFMEAVNLRFFVLLTVLNKYFKISAQHGEAQYSLEQISRLSYYGYSNCQRRYPAIPGGSACRSNRIYRRQRFHWYTSTCFRLIFSVLILTAELSCTTERSPTDGGDDCLGFLPLWPRSTSPKRLLLATVITTNISMTGTAIPLEVNVDGRV